LAPIPLPDGNIIRVPLCVPLFIVNDNKQTLVLATRYPIEKIETNLKDQLYFPKKDVGRALQVEGMQNQGLEEYKNPRFLAYYSEMLANPHDRELQLRVLERFEDEHVQLNPLDVEPVNNSRYAHEVLENIMDLCRQYFGEGKDGKQELANNLPNFNSDGSADSIGGMARVEAAAYILSEQKKITQAEIDNPNHDLILCSRLEWTDQDATAYLKYQDCYFSVASVKAIVRSLTSREAGIKLIEKFDEWIAKLDTGNESLINAGQVSRDVLVELIDFGGRINKDKSLEQEQLEEELRQSEDRFSRIAGRVNVVHGSAKAEWETRAEGRVWRREFAKIQALKWLVKCNNTRTD
jgi:hypothetical protein